jgi:hypothetical protein
VPSHFGPYNTAYAVARTNIRFRFSALCAEKRKQEEIKYRLAAVGCGGSQQAPD